jgi:hypothetical protein
MQKTTPARREPRAVVSAALTDAVQTGADSDSPVTRSDGASASGWQDAIDYKLIEWGRDPCALVDEGIDAPTRVAISQAVQWACDMRDKGCAPPTQVVPDPNGGIVFERRIGDEANVIHFWSDGSIEFRRFQGSRLIERREVRPASDTDD